MLVGTDVCVWVVFVWEETGVPGGNPPAWLGNHMTISHADAGYRTRVTAVRGECVNTGVSGVSGVSFSNIIHIQYMCWGWLSIGNSLHDRPPIFLVTNIIFQIPN